jgi:hypothetical protein
MLIKNKFYYGIKFKTTFLYVTKFVHNKVYTVTTKFRLVKIVVPNRMVDIGKSV